VTEGRPTVALIEDLPAHHRQVLAEALPGFEIGDGRADGDLLRRAGWIIARDGVIDRVILEHAHSLRGIVRFEFGDGAVDEAMCAGLGVTVHTIASPALATVAEHAVMMILMLFKRYLEASSRLRAGVMVEGVAPRVTTQDSYAYNWVGLERFEALRGQTVGLVGLGAIGSEAARLLRCFGADVVYTKRNRLSPAEEETRGFRFASFDQLLRQSRCVSMHNRFDPETERMMGTREFRLMPPGSFFVNTARGRLVDEGALVDALKSGHLAGAALDVFWYEPVPPDSPLMSAPNLIMTPHTGGIPLAESQTIELRQAARLISEADG
jgi:phosphoglycerate dehydrogenase-like enzyme